MHNAPPVAYPLGRSRFQGFLLLGLWLAGAAVVTLWWSAAPGFGWRHGLALTVVVGSAVLVGWGWQNPAIGQLHWDGQDWYWKTSGEQDDRPAQGLVLALDFQRILLLRLRTHGKATVWLWADRFARPERWLDLRRAVYSRRKASPVLMPPDLSTSVAAADFFIDSHPPRPYP